MTEKIDTEMTVDIYVCYKKYKYWKKDTLWWICHHYGTINEYIEHLARNLIQDCEKRETYSVICPHIQIKGKIFSERDKCDEFYADTMIYCETCRKAFYITLDTDEGTVKIEEER